MFRATFRHKGVEYMNIEYKFDGFTIVTADDPLDMPASCLVHVLCTPEPGMAQRFAWVKEAGQVGFWEDAAYVAVGRVVLALRECLETEVDAANESYDFRGIEDRMQIRRKGLDQQIVYCVMVPESLPFAKEIAEEIMDLALESLGIILDSGVQIGCGDTRESAAK
jgi:hypothetical protein